MTRLEATIARKEFANVVKAVGKGERFLVTRHGKSVAAVVSARDLAYLRALEDKIDREAADAALADAEKHGTIPWETIKARLGL